MTIYNNIEPGFSLVEYNPSGLITDLDDLIALVPDRVMQRLAEGLTFAESTPDCVDLDVDCLPFISASVERFCSLLMGRRPNVFEYRLVFTFNTSYQIVSIFVSHPAQAASGKEMILCCRVSYQRVKQEIARRILIDSDIDLSNQRVINHAFNVLGIRDCGGNTRLGDYLQPFDGCVTTRRTDDWTYEDFQTLSDLSHKERVRNFIDSAIDYRVSLKQSNIELNVVPLVMRGKHTIAVGVRNEPRYNALED